MGSGPPPSRRRVLKALGTATTSTAIGGSILFTDRAAAANATISDTAWNDYEPWQKDQIDTCTEDGCISPNSTIHIPNPESLGFDICVDTGDGEVCVSMDSQLTADYYQCAGQDIWAAGAEIENFVNGTFVWSVSVWLGVDSDDCLWIGMDTGEAACEKLGCPGTYDSNPTIWDIRWYLEDIRPEMMSFIRNHNNSNPEIGSTTALVVAVLVVSGGALAKLESGGGFSAGPGPA